MHLVESILTFHHLLWILISSFNFLFNCVFYFIMLLLCPVFDRKGTYSNARVFFLFSFSYCFLFFLFFFLSCKRSFFCDISRTACRRLLKFFLSRFRSIRHLLNEKFFFPQLWGLPNPKNRRNRSSRMI